ncbi:MAG: PIN domain-containing protein [Candidatus Thermoplasmatota archaeon]|jgi:predicted nucleic acid-binding protein|nr:PIN domain-containing protein [Candidatus Thermoplasmatota archaeon]
MLKIIIDTNVILAMLYSHKSVNVSASRKIYDLLISDRLDASWCDIFSGETVRIANTDPKLSKVKKPYFEARFTELLNHMNDISMDKVNKTRLSIAWDPRDKYNINENDIYLAVIAEITKSRYILTKDKAFMDAYNNNFDNKIALACTPEKFLSLEKTL